MNCDNTAAPVQPIAPAHRPAKSHEGNPHATTSDAVPVSAHTINNQANPGGGVRSPAEPDEHRVNEALIAKWTKRVGIWTGVLAILTGLLVVASGVSAFFLLESDWAIEGQLHEMHAQTETTRAQVRANIGPSPWGVEQIKQNAQLVAWSVTPQWKNTGSTDALDVVNWWSSVFIEQHYDSVDEIVQKLNCPAPQRPLNIRPFVIQAQHPFAQEARTISAGQILKAMTKEGQIIVMGRIEYHDVFPDDPLHFVDWCTLFFPNDPTNGRFSLFTIRQDAR